MENIESFDNFVATFNAAGLKGRKQGQAEQVHAAIEWADSRLKRRDLKNPDFKTLALAELKKRSLDCDKLLRSGRLEDSKNLPDVQEAFGWVMAAVENLCILEDRDDLLEIVNASA